jgi:hypothetical protein
VKKVVLLNNDLEKESRTKFNETKQTVRGVCFVVSHNFRAPSNLHSLIDICEEEEDPSTKDKKNNNY